jgi:hypothetical protein
MAFPYRAGFLLQCNNAVSNPRKNRCSERISPVFARRNTASLQLILLITRNNILQRERRRAIS